MASVLVLSFDIIGRRMAGTGIRYWNLARMLAREHQVTLAAPSPVNIAAPEGVEIVSYRGPSEDDQSLGSWRAGLIADHDIVLGQDLPYYDCDPEILRNRRLVVDLYAPAILEKLEYARIDPERGEAERADDVRSLNRLLALGDFFICASERQRDFWLGALAAAGRLTLHQAQADPELRSLIDVVPFGLPEDSPVKTGRGPRGTIPGIGQDDKVLLWNGGLWNWLDPVTAIRAVGRLTADMPELRLVFMGTRNPLQHDIEMEMAARARHEAERLGLLEKYVFFHDWVPYEERQNWLLEADAALSMHVPTAEARYAFRTRIMDLLWCRVPVVASEGDVLAELVEQESIGLTVPPGDVDAAATAIRRILDPDARRGMVAKFKALEHRYSWAAVSEPLMRYCRESSCPDPDRGAAPMQSYIHHLERTYRDTADYARRLESVIEEQRRGIESSWDQRIRRLLSRLRRVR